MTEPEEVIEKIAAVSEAIGRQAGVGAMETAGSIVSFLAAHPEHVADFMAGRTSPVDWPIDWHEQGRLSWHGMDGKIHRPAYHRSWAKVELIQWIDRDAQWLGVARELVAA